MKKSKPVPPMGLYNAKNNVAIVVGGGPAPGINGVIRAATIEAIKSGLNVIGVYDGYKWLSRGLPSHTELLSIDTVSRIHYQGGSILRTSRTNPTKSKKTMQNVIGALTELEVDYLISIGGDDTCFTASRLVEMAGDQIQVVHVPKTIDNDLPLPGRMYTFGYQTARSIGAHLIGNIMEDAYTTSRWYFVVAMGRAAGHLALGIGNAAGATLSIIAEEFNKQPIRLSHLCDILEGAIIKRKLLGRDFGVALLSEGLIESIDKKDLLKVRDSMEKDSHGNIRFAEIALAGLVKNEVRQRLSKRGLDCTIVNKNIGYELRCEPPIPEDQEYTQNLGYSAVKFLLEGGTGAMMAIRDGAPYIIPFGEIIDSKTGKIQTRKVNVQSPFYRMCREYMVRLDKTDFEDPKRVSRLARTANCSPGEFRTQFCYLVDNGF